MPKPIRIQRQRKKFWTMPPNTVYVGRGTKWGNPWRVGLVTCGCRAVGECNHNTMRCATAAEAVECYREWVMQGSKRKVWAVEELRGKNLACWCKDGQPCHADVLLEIANA
jgi:hypothetical protein